MLDASKAFDRVEYVKLFTTLRNRKICPVVLRLLMNMYINQQIQVKWNNMISPTCTISNGVKQGGCMSPTLFSIYLDKLLGILRASNVGCRYGNHYMGAFCYADDISLLSPTVSGLQDMLKYVNVMLINIKYILMPVKVNYYVLIQVLVPKVKI